MADIMQSISYVLSAAGYRTGDASPGRIMPEVTEPVVAVNLEHLDTAKLSMTIRATVVSPLSLGARACEDEAMNICRILQQMGAECELESCQLNAKTEHFYVPVMASFRGNILDDGWKIGDACQVKFGSVNLQKVISFQAWREKGSEMNSLEEAQWQFRVEERLDGIGQESAPAEPFVLTVIWEGSQERYEECVLTLQKRVIEDGHFLQIREGTAKTRTVTG